MVFPFSLKIYRKSGRIWHFICYFLLFYCPITAPVSLHTRAILILNYTKSIIGYLLFVTILKRGEGLCAKRFWSWMLTIIYAIWIKIEHCCTFIQTLKEHNNSRAILRTFLWNLGITAFLLYANIKSWKETKNMLFQFKNTGIMLLVLFQNNKHIQNLKLKYFQFSKLWKKICNNKASCCVFETVPLSLLRFIAIAWSVVF